MKESFGVGTAAPGPAGADGRPSVVRGDYKHGWLHGRTVFGTVLVLPNHPSQPEHYLP